MRATTWLTALMAGLNLAGWTHAQSPFGGGGGPVQYKIVTTNDPNSPIAAPMSVAQPNGPQRFFSSSPGRISNGSPIGRSTFPSEAQMPADEYLKAFHIKRVQRTGFYASGWWPWNWF